MPSVLFFSSVGSTARVVVLAGVVKTTDTFSKVTRRSAAATARSTLDSSSILISCTV